MKNFLALCAAALLMAGCSTVHVVPQPIPGATINPADRSITASAKGVTVSARVQDLEVAPYRFETNVASFYVALVNGTTDALTVPHESFFLLDSGGNQYRPLHPASIQEMVSSDSAYLIPYPYVGFYYQEDFEEYGFFNTFNSALPYYAENHPQDVPARALSADRLLPGARAGGEVYFPVDLASGNSFELRLYLPGTPVAGTADFTFPFRVEK